MIKGTQPKNEKDDENATEGTYNCPQNRAMPTHQRRT